MRSFYKDHEQGRNGNNVWIISALTLLVCFWLVLHIQPIAVFEYLLSGGPGSKITDFIRQLHLPETFWEYFRPSAFFLIALWFIQKKLRKRPFGKLINGDPQIRFRWKRMLAAMIVFVFLSFVSWAICYVFKNFLTQPSLGEQLGPISERFKPITVSIYANKTSLRLLLILAPLIAFNALIQEMVFRGFIDQGLSRFIKTPLAIFALSGFIYALSYINMASLSQYAYSGEWNLLFIYSLNIMFLGIFLSIITYIDNGIEAATGLSIAGAFYIERFSLPFFEFFDLETTSPLTYEMINFIDTIIFNFLALLILAFWQFGLGKHKRHNG